MTVSAVESASRVRKSVFIGLVYLTVFKPLPRG
jgi:hypothetical protein